MLHLGPLLQLGPIVVTFRTSCYICTFNRPVGLDEVKLPPGVKVRHLYSPVKENTVKNVVQQIRYSVVSAEQPVLYYLSEGPRRSFTREELQVVPSDTEIPPKI